MFSCKLLEIVAYIGVVKRPSIYAVAKIVNNAY
jgi:hypothetical protein